MKLVLVAIFFNLVSNASAYENMIKHGYANCMTCHHAPSGGGQLNDYGKVIAGEMAIFKKTDLPTPKNLEHGLQARYARYESKGEVRNFPMQFDYLMAFKTGKVQTLFTGAKAPSKKEKDKKSNSMDELYVRKAMLMYTINEFQVLEFGRDYLNIGLNMEDHTLFIRKNNRRGVTDFVTTLRYNLFSENYKLSPFIYGPNGQEDSGNKEKGLGVKLERYFNLTKATLSATYLDGQTDNIKRQEIALTAKKAIGDFVFLSQIDFTKRQLQKDSSYFNQEIYLLMASYFPIDPIQLRVSQQKINVNGPFESNQEQTNYAIQARILANLSLQMDQIQMQNNETYSMIQMYFNGWF